MRLRERVPLVCRALDGGRTYLQKGLKNSCEKKAKISTSILGDSELGKSVCWYGPNPEAGKSNEVPEVELTRLSVGLSVKTKGSVRENFLWPNVGGAGSPLSKRSVCDIISEHGL